MDVPEIYFNKDKIDWLEKKACRGILSWLALSARKRNSEISRGSFISEMNFFVKMICPSGRTKNLFSVELKIIMLFIFLPPSNISAIAFVITFGFLWLATVPPTAGIVGFIFGTKYIGLLYGFVFLSHQVGSFLGAYLSGVFYDLYGSFDYAWYISIALSIFAGLIHLPIKEKAIERVQTA